MNHIRRLCNREEVRMQNGFQQNASLYDQNVNRSDLTLPVYPRSIRTAVVHDWLIGLGSHERMLEQIMKTLPSVELYSLVDYLGEDERSFLRNIPVNTSFIQRLPFSKNKFEYYQRLAPLAIELFDLSSYDVIVSSSHIVAKAVQTRANQLHISYVYSTRPYIWDQQYLLLNGTGKKRTSGSNLTRLMRHHKRNDVSAGANHVDVYVASSQHVADQIRKIYRRTAPVIYPPLDTDLFSLYEKKEEYYVTVSRLVPDNRVDLIVRAFSMMPDKELIVIGDGPEYRKIKNLAGPNVSMFGHQPVEVVRHYVQRSRAFILAAEENFSIASVEAQACGTPVIAYGRGGITETVIPGETGIFFHEQSIPHLCHAVRIFERIQDRMDPVKIRASTLRFSTPHFTNAFGKLIEKEFASFRKFENVFS